ncbi:hypothetical protein [Microbacterium sp. ZW T5_56]|uniref:hypothetical protein n=1 Tax=Microbacterium sp. ZW T5_56 TaxID=3378081 RepID=UPI0038540F66
MPVTRTTTWTAAGILLLGIGLVAALSAMLVPAGADSLSALVITVAAALAVVALAVGPGSLLRGIPGVIGAFVIAVLPVVAVILQIVGVHSVPLFLIVQLMIVIGGVLLVADLTRARPARPFTMTVGVAWVLGLALVAAAAGWTSRGGSFLIPGPVGVLTGSWVLAIASLLLGVALLGAVRMIALSEQSAYPGASEVTDR